MRTVGKVILGLIVGLVLILVIGAQFISTDDILQQVSEKVEQQTGRKLTIDGAAKLNVLPFLALEINDIKFANVVTSDVANMVTINQVTLHMSWWAALFGEIKIDKFVFDTPKIHLEKNNDGSGNWQFASREPSQTNGEDSKQTGKLDLALNLFEIKNATIVFYDNTSQKQQSVDQLNAEIRLPALNQLMHFDGNFEYQMQKIQVSATVDNLSALFDKQEVTLKANVTSALFDLTINGVVAANNAGTQGDVLLEGNSLKQLLAWHNIDYQSKDNAMNKFSIASKINLAEQQLMLADIRFTLDQLEVSGFADLRFAEQPVIKGNFNLGTLDLNPYLVEKSPKIEPEENAPAQPVVWDSSPLDLSALKTLNADITIQSTQLNVRNIKLGKNALHLVMHKGDIRLDLTDFSGYQGSGVGSVLLDVNKKPYQISSKFNLSDISAEQLLTDVIGFNKLQGKGALQWEFATKGNSQKQFIDNLSGQISFGLQDGAILGVNLAAIARSAQNVLAGNLAAIDLDKDFSQAEKTDFASFSSSFNFTNGNAQTNDISLLNPFIRVTGEGNINLPDTSLKLHLKTKVVAAASAQVAQTKESGVTIPIKISGQFHQVKIRPDVTAQAKDELKDKVKNKLLSLFGNG